MTYVQITERHKETKLTLCFMLRLPENKTVDQVVEEYEKETDKENFEIINFVKCDKREAFASLAATLTSHISAVQTAENKAVNLMDLIVVPSVRQRLEAAQSKSTRAMTKMNLLLRIGIKLFYNVTVLLAGIYALAYMLRVFFHL